MPLIEVLFWLLTAARIIAIFAMRSLISNSVLNILDLGSFITIALWVFIMRLESNYTELVLKVKGKPDIHDSLRIDKDDLNLILIAIDAGSLEVSSEVRSCIESLKRVYSGIITMMLIFMLRLFLHGEL